MNDRNHMYAEPERESDEVWLKRVVFELTGREPVDFADSPSLCRLYFGISGSTLLATSIEHKQLLERDVSAVSAALHGACWPLKDSVTGSAGTAEGNQAGTAPSGTGLLKPAQPVAEATCAECRAPCTGTLCVYCSLRSSPKYVDSAVAERTASLPGQVAARERVAAFERRNRPRESATARELEREHPWSNAEDFEP